MCCEGSVTFLNPFTIFFYPGKLFLDAFSRGEKEKTTEF